MAEAEEQIGMVWEVLDSNEIPKVSLSDDESKHSVPVMDPDPITSPLRIEGLVLFGIWC